MTEKSFFIQVLSDHLAGRKTTPQAGIDWKTIAYYARSHRVEGIVFYQCKEFIPSEWHASFEQALGATLFYYKNRERALKEIGAGFTEIGVPFLIVKGMEVAGCYPIPALRTMGDIDILVHKEDKEKAGKALEKMGFYIKDKNPDSDWPCFRNEMEYELHHHLIYRETVTHTEQERFFNRYWDYEKNDHLDWSFHFLFLLSHLRKHLMNKGVGFRMFLDIAAVMKNRTLNWQWIDTKLTELDMDKFARVCFGLIERWFHVKAPLDGSDLNDVFIKRATDRIFSNGLFGFHDEKNQVNGAVNQMTKYGKGSLFSRLVYLFQLMFPNYNNMAASRDYSFIRRKPWLLPAAWIYRFYRLFTRKTSSVSDLLKHVGTPKAVISEREEELREWGLAE